MARERREPALSVLRKRATAALLSAPRYELLPLDGVVERAAQLPDGATVTVTCSPTKGQDVTVDVACELAARGFRVVPHLAARRIRSAGHLTQVVGRLEEAGVDDVFVVGGDGGEPEGPYPTALALLEAMAAQGAGFGHVGIAGHPEGHHHADDPTLDALLVAKQPFATYVTTQVCFDTQVVATWARRIRRRGVALPIHAGVPGVVDSAKLLRVSMRIGIGDSVRFLRKNRAAALRLMRAGSYRPDALVRQLAALEGDAAVDGLHLYTFNEAGATSAWVARVRARSMARRAHQPRRTAFDHTAGGVEGTPDRDHRRRRPSRLRLVLSGRGG